MPVIIIIENKNVINTTKILYTAAIKLYIIAGIKGKFIIKRIAKIIGNTQTLAASF